MVTLSEAKRYLRVTHGGDDALIQHLLDGATVWVLQVAECTTTTGGDPDLSERPLNLDLAVLELVRRAYDARGGIESEGQAGWSANWSALATSDILHLISPSREMGV